MPESNASLKKELQEKASITGADLFGVADLSEARQFIKENYEDISQQYPKALSIGVYFPAKIINLLEMGPQQVYSYYYEVLNNKLDELALIITNYLFKAGYDALPIPASQQLMHNKYKSMFSHRLAASLAGLGWIGKSCCLVNEKFGPRLRLVTVLTGAPLEPDLPVANKCGNCTACVDACTPGAIKGLPFEPAQSLRERFDAKACDKHFQRLKEQYGIGNCGKCLAACPWGK